MERDIFSAPYQISIRKLNGKARGKARIAPATIAFLPTLVVGYGLLNLIIKSSKNIAKATRASIQFENRSKQYVGGQEGHTCLKKNKKILGRKHHNLCVIP